MEMTSNDPLRPQEQIGDADSPEPPDHFSSTRPYDPDDIEMSDSPRPNDLSMLYKKNVPPKLPELMEVINAKDTGLMDEIMPGDIINVSNSIKTEPSEPEPCHQPDENLIMLPEGPIIKEEKEDVKDELSDVPDESSSIVCEPDITMETLNEGNDLPLTFDTTTYQRILNNQFQMKPSEKRFILRWRIIELRMKGLTNSQIAKELKVSRTTVCLWIKKWNTGGNLLDKPRPGGIRRTTPEEDLSILAHMKDNPFSNAVAIQEEQNLKISSGIIRSRLREAGLMTNLNTPAKKEKLEGQHKKKRLLFAKKYVNEDVDFWSKMIFSDERIFAIGTDGKMYTWRPRNTRHDLRYIKEINKRGHITANVWGWCFLNGLGEMAEVHGQLNSRKYIEILEEVMVPSVRSYAMPFPEKISFMQDKSPLNTSPTVVNWFKKQEDIQLHSWPAQRCDINPFEHIWTNIANSWDQERDRTPEEIIQHVKEGWEAARVNSRELINNHVLNMSKKLQMIIERDGSWTRY